jgi:hypothetical protein
MLRKLFTAALLLAVTATANATPMKINGFVDFFAVGGITLDETGAITQIDYFFNSVAYLEANLKTGKTNDFFTEMEAGDTVTTTSPLVIAAIEAVNLETPEGEAPIGVNLWSVGGFSFDATEVSYNETKDGFTGLAILGTLSHEGFADTVARYFISAQSLTLGVNNGGFSATLTSPAPISEPGTLAIFGLALVGFAASRKKKSA